MPPAATAAAVEELENANFCFGAKAASTPPRRLGPSQEVLLLLLLLL